MARLLHLAALLAAAAVSVRCHAQLDRVPEQMSYLDNGVVRIGVDLTLGGAITFVAKSGTSDNLINSADWGRQIQMSHYCGPVPFKPNGKEPSKTWVGLGWNPIQSGDCFGHRSTILAHRNDGQELYVKCVPMQWPLDNEPGECTFECWLRLKDNTIQVRSRMLNRRSDKTQYPARDQELPAIYTNGPWYRLMTYTGDKPFTNDKLTHIPPQFPWAGWQATENWAALVNDADQGIGIYEPGVFRMIGGFAGQPGKGGPRDGPTGYIAPLHVEVLDWNIDYDYRYTLIVGSLDEIRAAVTKLAGPSRPPAYDFARDRQHWHFVNTTDAGWPIHDGLKVSVAGDDPQMIGPPAFWLAADGPVLRIRASHHTSPTRMTVFWSRQDAPGYSHDRSVDVAVVADGTLRTYTIDLSREKEYRGIITGLRVDPASAGKPNEYVIVRSIAFDRAPDR